jgi:hypothetical protein
MEASKQQDEKWICHCLLLESTNALLHFTTYSVFVIKKYKAFKIFMKTTPTCFGGQATIIKELTCT